MTEALASKTCTPCRGGIPPLTREQAELFHAQVPDWQLADEAHRIERSFRFGNFREALTLVQQIGELAEAEGHHPNISFGWGNATVSLQTKKIKGLHENDFIMATKIDRNSLAWPRHERVLVVLQLCAPFSMSSTCFDVHETVPRCDCCDCGQSNPNFCLRHDSSEIGRTENVRSNRVVQK